MSDYLDTFDLTAETLDLSPVLALIQDKDIGLLGRIKLGGECKDTTVKWVEDALLPYTVTLSDADWAAGTTETDMTLATNHYLRLRVGDVLIDTSHGKTELIRVVTCSSDTVTVARGINAGYTAGTGESHANGSIWRVVARPRLEGADATSDISAARTQPYNYTQIFERAVKISGSLQKRDSLVVKDEMLHQIMLRTQEIYRELSIALVCGARSASVGSATVYQTFGGLINAVNYGLGTSQSATDMNVTTTDEELTTGVLDSMIASVEDDGGDLSHGIIVGSRTQIGKIANFDRDKLNLTQSEKQRGVYVTQYLANNGWVLDLVRCKWVPNDVLLVLDPSRISLRWYRQLATKVLPETGDFTARDILGECTLEVKNAKEAHAIHTALKA